MTATQDVYTCPEWRAFVRAICAEPAEDTPRLVAADWLEEQGDKVDEIVERFPCGERLTKRGDECW